MASATTPTRTPDPDATVLDALRTGDDAAFGTLVARHHTAMVTVTCGTCTTARWRRT